MEIARRLEHFDNQLQPYNCSLIAVSKTKPSSLVLEAYDAGHRDFGENRVQDLEKKYEELPKDIRWHMIGHLQRNKVKYIAPFVHLIHGVDSEKLLNEIDKRGANVDRTINCLLQVHIAKEETKFGFDEDELFEFLDSERLNKLKNIEILGLMGIATNTDNKKLIKKEFAYLSSLLKKIETNYGFDNLNPSELSMGMSSDFEIALEEGSTMIRVGTAIFGARNY
ncbi:MAG: YggS family pyridoxal phosphate-dependent enzyme [Cyclobacteriaceae bacterium]